MISQPQDCVDILGTTIFHLVTEFLPEAIEYFKNQGKDPYTATFRDLEDLSGPDGFIRLKGKHLRCPNDKRLGTSYVISARVLGRDHVRSATHMLSYSWNYGVVDTIRALDHYCDIHDYRKDEVSIWICCLCNNQHRIADKIRTREAVATDEFMNVFRTRVVSIGRILSLMTPWDRPAYLKRAWCVFEFYTALVNDVDELTIVIPPSEEESLIESIMSGRYDDVLKALGQTKIEDAEASQESDREYILSLVKEGPGYHMVNSKVNEKIREWVDETLIEVIGKTEKDSVDVLKDMRLANMYYQAGDVYRLKGQFDESLRKLNEALMIFENVLDDKLDTRLANCHNSIGLVYQEEGEYSKALESHMKALTIHESLFGDDHPSTAISYTNIGGIHDEEGRYFNAIQFYMRAHEIYKKVLGEEHPDTATSYNDIGGIYNEQGMYSQALKFLLKGVQIREKILGEEHPETATSYNDIGLVYQNQGNFPKALEYHTKALENYQKVLGEEHPETATSYSNIGGIYNLGGEYSKALHFCMKALEIEKKVLGTDHHDTATSYTNIGLIHSNQGEYSKALNYHLNALTIREKVLGEDHPDTVESCENFSLAYQLSAMIYL